MTNDQEALRPKRQPIANDFMSPEARARAGAGWRWNGPRLNWREAVALAQEELRLKRKLTAEERAAIIAKLV